MYVVTGKNDAIVILEDVKRDLRARAGYGDERVLHGRQGIIDALVGQLGEVTCVTKNDQLWPADDTLAIIAPKVYRLQRRSLTLSLKARFEADSGLGPAFPVLSVEYAGVGKWHTAIIVRGDDSRMDEMTPLLFQRD